MRLNLPPHVDAKHPVLLQEYAVFTPPVAEMAAKLGDWIEQQQPGGYIFGPSRFGKSRGVKWHLREILNERFAATLPLYIWVRPADSHASETGFWKSWLTAVNHRYQTGRRGATEWRTVFREFLISAALSAGATLVVLIVDEAQDMTVREWKWLLGLQNTLDWEGFRLSVFSIASHQMGYQYELMGHADHAHVAARFLVAHWPFPGLSSEAELAFVLQGYDTESEWPKGSGVSYLAHFAPAAFERGERLARSAAIFWRVHRGDAAGELSGPANVPDAARGPHGGRNLAAPGAQRRLGECPHQRVLARSARPDSLRRSHAAHLREHAAGPWTTRIGP